MRIRHIRDRLNTEEEGVSALLTSNQNMETRLDEVLYGECGTDYFEDFPPLFHPEDVTKGRAETVNKAPEKKDTKKDKESETDSLRYKEETLIAEIDGLHRKIHVQEGNIKVLRNELAEKRRMSEEITRLKDQLETQQKELTALRDHVYNLTEEDEVRESISVDEMREYLKTLRIIIIGGHKNWRQKMKQEFPDWTYVDASVSGTMEASVVDRAEYHGQAGRRRDPDHAGREVAYQSFGHQREL